MKMLGEDNPRDYLEPDPVMSASDRLPEGAEVFDQDGSAPVGHRGHKVDPPGAIVTEQFGHIKK